MCRQASGFWMDLSHRSLGDTWRSLEREGERFWKMAAAKPVRHGGGEGSEILLDFKNEGPSHFKRDSAND